MYAVTVTLEKKQLCACVYFLSACIFIVMHAEESLLGLSALLVRPEDEDADVGPPQPQPQRQAPPATASDDMPLPRFLFSFGISPTSDANAEALIGLLHHEGMKAVDARLKAAGVKSIGQRLRIQTAVQKAADNSAAVPSVPAPPKPPKPPPASEVVELVRADGHDLEALIALAGSGPDRTALTAELKRLGYKTGARLKLEQALSVIAAERAKEENARIVREAREEAVKAHEEAQRAERARLQAEAAARAAEAAAKAKEAEEAAKAERAALYAQYEREMMSEVDKLKLARKQANAAKREKEEKEREERKANGAGGADCVAGGAQAGGHAASLRPAEQPVLADATDGNGGVQGLEWCERSMHLDDDGDAAHAFFIVRGSECVAVPAASVAVANGGEGGGEGSASEWLALHAEDHTGAAAELNQYWYSASTIATLCNVVRECRALQRTGAGGAGAEAARLECAFVSTPSLFYSLGCEERSCCRVLDYDTALGEEVVFYDFNAPTTVPAEVRRYTATHCQAAL